MSIYLFYILFIILLSIAGFGGALVSVYVQNNILHWIWLYLPILLSASIWVYICTKPDFYLYKISMAFDIIYGIGYVLGFLYVGEIFSIKSLIGGILITIGVILL